MAESGLQLSKAPASREACSTPSATSMPIGSGSMCGAESFEAVKDDICSIAKWVQDTQLLHESQVTPRGLRLPGSVGGTMDPSKGSSFADPMSPVEGFFDTISSTGSGTGSDAYFGLSSLALRRGSEVSSIVSPCVDQLRAVLDKTPAGGFFIEHTAIRFHSPGQEHTPFASYMGNSAARPLTSTCTIETNSLREHEAAAAKCVWRPSMTGKMSFDDVFEAISLCGRVPQHHPNVVAVIGVSVDEKGSIFCYTPYQGESISLENLQITRHALRKRPLFKTRPREVVSWLNDVVEGLLHLHTNCGECVIHGSITMSNILVIANESGAGSRVMVMDHVFNRNLSRRRGLDEESDIREIGLVVWQLYHGKLIFDDSGAGPAYKGSAPFAATVDGKELYISRKDVTAKSIGHKGMRGLFKRCQFTEGSKHIPCRTVTDLASSLRKLLNISSMAPNSSPRDLSGHSVEQCFELGSSKGSWAESSEQRSAGSESHVKSTLTAALGMVFSKSVDLSRKAQNARASSMELPSPTNGYGSIPNSITRPSQACLIRAAQANSSLDLSSLSLDIDSPTSQLASSLRGGPPSRSVFSKMFGGLVRRTQSCEKISPESSGGNQSSLPSPRKRELQAP